MRPISHCLNKQLTEICQGSLQLEELSIKIAQLLPPDLAAQCRVGSFNKGCLVLTTHHANWATQIRYTLPELRDKLRKEAGMYQLSSIKINLLPPSTLIANPCQPEPKPLSEKAKACILSESQQCTYEPLKRALLHLADEG